MKTDSNFLNFLEALLYLPIALYNGIILGRYRAESRIEKLPDLGNAFTSFKKNININ